MECPENIQRGDFPVRYRCSSLFHSFLVISCLIALFAMSGTAYAGGNWVINRETGCRAWSYSPGADTTFTWTGACKDGYVDGEGTMKWVENGELGNTYIGQYSRGKEHGAGTFIWLTSGAIYKGGFINGLRGGKGVQTFADGERYDGNWGNDLPNGKGVYLWAKGARYEGDFVNQLMHGYGTLTLRNGRVFSGRWENSNYLGP